MKNILSIAVLSLGIIGLASCDSVSEPDRFIPAEIEPQRSVLIEEFTGQNCTNCPDGHAAIRDITASLGDSVVAVGIHASGLALNPPYGYRTQTGEQYYRAVGSPALPTAVINMQTAPLQVAEWGSAIDKLIMQPTPFTVRPKATVNGTELDIEVAFSSGDDYQGKLMVWIVENDLIGRQDDHGVIVPDYVHNHVFRAAATDDIWGEEVDLKAHTPQTLKFNAPIEDTWNPDNIYVVAFLYNDDGVAQVAQTAKH